MPAGCALTDSGKALDEPTARARAARTRAGFFNKITHCCAW